MLVRLSGGFLAEQCHLEGQKYLAGALEGVVGKRSLTKRITQRIERHAEAGFDLLFGERVIVGHQ